MGDLELGEPSGEVLAGELGAVGRKEVVATDLGKTGATGTSEAPPKRGL
jgi:hypothetical protein